jgi:hypothetical protein
LKTDGYLSISNRQWETETFEKRSLLPNPGVRLKFNPRNTQCIPVAKIFACLGFAPRLNVKEFNGAGKIEHFSKISNSKRSETVSYDETF